MNKRRAYPIALALLIVLGGSSKGICASTGALPPRAQNTAVKHVTVNDLIEQLAAPGVTPRLNALKALAAMGPKAASAVPAIVNVLNDNRVTGFGAMGSGNSPAITDQVLETLQKIGHGAKGAAPYLVPMLTDKNELFRRGKILETLLATGLDDSATKSVVRVTREEGRLTPTRLTAIKLLGEIEPPAGEARDVLQDIIDDRNDKASRDEAIKALFSINDRLKEQKPGAKTAAEEAITAMRDDLDKDAEKPKRLAAIAKAGAMGPAAAPLVPRLIQILGEQDSELCLAASKSLGLIGPDASAALPGLIARLFVEKDELDRGTVCRSITAIDPVGKRSIPLLLPSLEDPFKAKIAMQLLDEIATGESTAISQRTRARWRIK